MLLNTVGADNLNPDVHPQLRHQRVLYPKGFDYPKVLTPIFSRSRPPKPLRDRGLPRNEILLHGRHLKHQHSRQMCGAPIQALRS
ncbi:MAG: hypothetical protein EOR33_28590 [Mesorhizobium sp.]|uniref:hypothetical protein n=1 Tax=Mesorhizobium sp. TaxID=1871066 RepID=UPI000FE2C43F|nr:hypothetical protein [Mesorhizobium sp.]RWJ60432.1 MAG: hypothetical protein EOR33_28590 [Mesorhizobium sp.]RWK26995.1 MAG: hypothetical protein EOR44_29430 [Mesorhizobium sp.]